VIPWPLNKENGLENKLFGLKEKELTYSARLMRVPEFQTLVVPCKLG
jgi:hypothetical protein